MGESGGFDRFHGTETYIASPALRDAVNVAVALERPLLIKGDSAVQYEQVRKVMDALHTLPGTDTMLLAAEKLKE